jgi:hypothetical protein
MGLGCAIFCIWSVFSVLREWGFVHDDESISDGARCTRDPENRGTMAKNSVTFTQLLNWA